MRKLITLFILCAALNAGSQVPVVGSADNTNANVFQGVFNIAGKPLPGNKTEGIEGSPFLNDEWQEGTVKLTDGRTYMGIRLRFNLYNNELRFLKDSTEWLFASPVKEFSLIYTENNLPSIKLFRSGYGSVGKNSAVTFYEVIAQGPVIEIIRLRSKVINETSSYNKPPERSFAEENSLYVWDVINKMIHPLPGGSKSLKEALPQHAGLIEEFISENKQGIKGEGGLIKLAEQINTSGAGKQ